MEPKIERKTLDQLEEERTRQEYRDEMQKAQERAAGVVITEKDYECTGCQKIIPTGSKARSQSFQQNGKWETYHAHWPKCSAPEINTAPKEEKPQEEQQNLFEK